MTVSTDTTAPKRLAWELSAVTSSHPSRRSKPVFMCFVLLAGLVTTSQQAFCQSGVFSEPYVARMQMQLKVDSKVVNTIERGDLLTVVEEREKDVVIITHDGQRAAVERGNAAKLAESVEIYSELITENPKQGRLLTLRASAWWARGETEKALADFDAAISLGYDEPHAYASRGMFLASTGKFEAAIEDFTTAIVKDPKDTACYLNRAGVYMTVKDYANAIKDYDAALTIDPDQSTMFQQRAIAKKLSGDAEGSIADFSKAIDINPKFLDAVLGRGYLRFQRKEYAQAIEDFTAAIDINPQAAGAFNNRGYNHFLLKKYPEALADFDAAIKLMPQFALALQNKAWLLATADDMAIRNPGEAIKTADEACRMNDYRVGSDLMTLATAYASANQFQQAVGWQEKAIEIVAELQKEEYRRVLELFQQDKTYEPAPPKSE